MYRLVKACGYSKHNTFFGSLPIAHSTPSFTAVTSSNTPLGTSSADAGARRHPDGDCHAASRSRAIASTAKRSCSTLARRYHGRDCGSRWQAAYRRRHRLKSRRSFCSPRDLLPLLIAHPQALLEVAGPLRKLRAASAIIEDNSPMRASHGERSIAARVAAWPNFSKEGVRVELKVLTKRARRLSRPVA